MIKRCDLHGSAMGYSGSMGNSVRVTQNRFYGNANGLTSDTLSAPGHPGFPADGMKIDHNWFYSNNLDVYEEDFPFEPLVPQPVGSGIVWAGYNDGIFEGNRVFDNWRQGTMLLAVPDALAGDADGQHGQRRCTATLIGELTSTSCDNQYFDNRDGRRCRPGFKRHPGLTKFGNQSGLAGGGSVPASLPNGVDFWWDEFPGSDGNCWFDNTGADGSEGSVTSDPALLLPSACGPTSVGLGNVAKEAVLLVVLRRLGRGPDRPPVLQLVRHAAPAGDRGGRGRAARAGARRTGAGPAATPLSASRSTCMSTRASSASARNSRRAAALVLAAGLAASVSAAATIAPAERPAAGGEDRVVDVSGTEAVGQVVTGSVAPLAQCRDWNGADHEQKLATIDDVRSAINLEGTGIEAPPLSDEEALGVFDTSCRPDYAQGFRLYKLYARAAGFAPLLREIEE